jgi:hypothetical protein
VLIQRVQHHGTVPGPTATWTWTGDDWRLAPVHDAPAPPPTNPLLATDGAGQRVLYIDISAQLWAWDGASWTALGEGPEPLHRGGASMATDGRGNLILFGGAAAPPGGLYSDTWTWSARVGWSRRAGPAEPTPVVRPPVAPPPIGITAEHATRLATDYMRARWQNASTVRTAAGRARDFRHPGGGSPGGDRYVWAVLCTGVFHARRVSFPHGRPRPPQPPLTTAAVLLDYVTGEFVVSMMPAPPQLTER